MRGEQVRVGAGYEKTDGTDPGALGLVGLPAGSRIMGVPAWTATAGAMAARPSCSLVDARIGIDWDTSELSLNGSNLTNAKPNLGDIGYVGYAQYTQAGTIIPQVATLRPVTFIVEYTRSF